MSKAVKLLLISVLVYLTSAVFTGDLWSSGITKLQLALDTFCLELRLAVPDLLSRVPFGLPR